MNARIFSIVVAVLIVLGLGIWYVQSSNTSSPATSNETAGTTGSDTTTQTGSTGVSVGIDTSVTTTPSVVTYTNSGYSPKTLTVRVGTTVTFVNNSSSGMWTASNLHPTHTEYDNTSKNMHCVAGYTGTAPFDECRGDASGTSWSFTFTQAGTWPYHNHVNAGDTGTIVVTAQ